MKKSSRKEIKRVREVFISNLYQLKEKLDVLHAAAMYGKLRDIRHQLDLPENKLQQYIRSSVIPMGLLTDIGLESDGRPLRKKL